MVVLSDNHRRRRYALAAVTFTAALSIQSLFTSRPTTYNDANDNVEQQNNLHRTLYNIDHRSMNVYDDDNIERQNDLQRTLIDNHGLHSSRTINHPNDVVDTEADDLQSSSAGGFDMYRVDHRSTMNVYNEDVPESSSSSNIYHHPSKDSPPNMNISYANLIDNNEPIPPYNIEDALQSSNIFDSAYALLVYDPTSDAFVALHHKRHKWITSSRKMLIAFKEMTFLLRKIFPERFIGPGSDELVIPISSGDSPGVKRTCLDHFRRLPEDRLYPCEAYTAPILNFGSTFQDIFHQMIAMPPPVLPHLPCFSRWSETQDVCPALLPRQPLVPETLRNKLVYGDEYGIVQWGNLIPQVVWRGTDFNYLGRTIPGQRHPYPHENLINWTRKLARKFQENTILGGISVYQANVMKRKLNRIRERAPKRAAYHERRLQQFNKASAIKSMRDNNYESAPPRWKGIILTSEAELEAGPDELPWCNIKFANFMYNGAKALTVGTPPFNEWEDIGISAAGERINLEQLARYRYHIDIGGGGGTTWTGTIQKMAMPGLLFHHVTPTKDYIHDYMKPWVHYVPVKEDLSDLKEKYHWAESHPQEAKRISEEGTKLMRYLTSHEGYQDMYNKDIVEPLRRVMEAYQPLSQSQGHGWAKDWKDALHQLGEGHNLIKVMECSMVAHDRGVEFGEHHTCNNLSQQGNDSIWPTS